MVGFYENINILKEISIKKLKKIRLHEKFHHGFNFMKILTLNKIFIKN